jgi:hypothetical protein
MGDFAFGGGSSLPRSPAQQVDASRAAGPGQCSALARLGPQIVQEIDDLRIRDIHGRRLDQALQ